MREKLIELLKEAMVLSDGICRIVGNTQAKAIGHYLFAHGVTIPVRCKDCRYYIPKVDGTVGFCKCGEVCGYLTTMRVADCFCSYGERNGDGNA